METATRSKKKVSAFVLIISFLIMFSPNFLSNEVSTTNKFIIQMIALLPIFASSFFILRSTEMTAKKRQNILISILCMMLASVLIFFAIDWYYK
jgi:surface polysaccharide O-acyltransferase-like enzyme